MSDKELTGLIVFIVIAIVAVLALFFAIRNAIYRDFVFKNSVGIKKLKEINKKYNFYQIGKYELRHSYDNSNFYHDISCVDYLVYQLVYDRKYVMDQINHALSNKTLFATYLKETKEKCCFGNFDNSKLPRSKAKLEKTERKIFKKALANPVILFDAYVQLTLTNINGRYIQSKSQHFGVTDIRTIVDQLSQNRNGYFTNEYIWNSICRVERGKVTNKMRFAIYRRDGYRCRYCGRRDNLEIDHIIPIAKGGKSTYNNLQTLCHRCNMKKGTSIIR